MVSLAGASGGCLAGATLGASLGWLFTWRRGNSTRSQPCLKRSSSIEMGHARTDKSGAYSNFKDIQFTDEAVMNTPKGDGKASPPRPKWERRQSGKFAINEHKVIEQKVVIAMVGLPARGKSYISKAVVRYLNFLGCPTRLFNAGNMRRQSGKAGMGADFFDASNQDAKQLREQLAMDCLEDLLEFLHKGGQSTAVGILDATNTTMARRQKVIERCLMQPGVRLIFLESLCDDEEILKNNYDLKLNNEDYQGMQAESALADFLSRVHKYESVYEPVRDEECSEKCGYIKLVNAGQTLICHRCRSKEDEYGVVRHIIGLMHSIDLGRRSIMLALVGETEHDRKSLLGGDSPLTDLGRQHAACLASIVDERERATSKPMLVMCGTLARHLETAEALKVSTFGKRRTVLKLQRMNELCAGGLDSLSYKDLQEQYPEEYEARQRDKLNYRYPGVGGESYQDLVSRLMECIMRLEQLRGNVVVLCDKAVCRVLLAYFRGISLEDMPTNDVPHGVTVFERTHVGFTEENIQTLGMHPVIGSGGTLSALVERGQP